MKLSFREKSLWLVFVGLLAAFAFYFTTVLPVREADVMPGHIGLFIAAIALLVATQVVGHIAIALFDRRTETDERDRLIELKGMRNAGYVLAAGVFLSLCVALVARGNFLFTHVLLGSWVLAQLVETGSQIYLHRRGA